MLRYSVYCATKVFDARTLHNKSFNAAILAERVIKATSCDWLFATTNVFERAYIGNKRLNRINFRIGQTFVDLVWTTKDKRFSKP